MRSPKIAIMYGPGTSSHHETKFAVEYGGGLAEILHIKALTEGEMSLNDYAGLIIPGGFSWGNHIAPGRIFATSLVARLKDELQGFIGEGRPILGIGNGAQILMEAGILPRAQVGERTAVALQNPSARFESRWVNIMGSEGTSPWLEGLSGRPLKLPVACGDMRFYIRDGVDFQPAFFYSEPSGKASQELAGLLDPSGMILGMIPQPERAIFSYSGSQDGLQIFKNLARLCKL